MSRLFNAVGLILTFAPTALAQPATPPTEKYAKAAQHLEQFINQELADKAIPAISIALVDDQQIVWAKGFGFMDSDKKKPASADTVYRVGSLSKLFTNLAILKLVEQGKLSLDEPVTKYLPDFKPKNQFDKPITLRHLMTDRSGLVREPPIGSYYHNDHPTLVQTVKSLNDIPLAFEPGTKERASNAGSAVAGYTLEVTQKTPFAKYVREQVLEPLGMKRSDLEPRKDLIQDLATGLMWTYHGRDFPAPTFELGVAPAASMYSTVNDLGKFISVMLAEGKTPTGKILTPETVQELFKPQFNSQKTLAFRTSDVGGKKWIDQHGAVYGFDSCLAFLPKDKLGVVVIASKDFAPAVVSRIAGVALDSMLAAKKGQQVPPIKRTSSLKRQDKQALAGRYRFKEHGFDLVASGDRLWRFPLAGEFRVELRSDGTELMSDDLMMHGRGYQPSVQNGTYLVDEFVRQTSVVPNQAPPAFFGLIGEYGWDYNTLYIFEKDGKLHVLIDWFYFFPLTQITENEYQFPDHRNYAGSKVIFQRDKQGRATQVMVESVVFKRRQLDGEDGKTFQIKPLKPVNELRQEAEKATPPVEPNDMIIRSQLTELTMLDKTIKLDLRYATDNNFMGTPLYPKSAKAYLQKPAAEALVRVHKKLEAQGYGLMIFDAYRPWYVTHMFWNATPVPMRMFVADPAKGSRHNRGCAVDLTLYERKSGKPIEMVSGFDEFSDRAYPDYLGGTHLQRHHRDMLRSAMEAEGFTVYEAEWWHFDYKDWKRYPIGNLRFEDLEKKEQ
jgi:serine beta-lactamase-like protein LACTB